MIQWCKQEKDIFEVGSVFKVESEIRIMQREQELERTKI